MRIPKAVIVWVVAAVGLLGTSLASAAVLSGAGGSGAPADEPTTTAVDEPTTTAPVEGPTTTVPGDQAGEPGDEPNTPGDEAGQPGDDQGDDASGVPRFYDGCGNFTSGTHGDYVSKVAHDPNSTPEDVRAAAHSDCGKPLSAVHQPPVTEGTPAAETSPPSHPSSPHTGPADGPTTPSDHGHGDGARDRGAGRGRH